MIRYAIEQHTVAFPSKVLAREGGKHIYNIQLKEDADNGWFTGKGAFVELDLYEQAAPNTFSGTVLEQAPNGNWYVEVVDPGDALFICQVPMIEEEYNNNFKKESNFFNAKNTVVRCYELAKGDVIEISEAGFAAKPAKKDTVTLKAITTPVAATYSMQLGK